MKYLAICSNKPHASTQNSHSKGHQYWRKDVYHLASELFAAETKCGLDASEYLKIGEMELDDAIGDFHLCEKCRRMLK